MRRLRALLLLLPLLGAGAAWAVSDPAEMLPDSRQEARAEAIGRELRCLVCQNEDIEDSGADLARDLRRLVRLHVAAGDSDAEIMRWMVHRYGAFIQLRPPFTATTAMLWAMPGLALLVGAGIALFALFRRRPEAPAPLDAAERARLALLLRPDAGSGR